MHFAARAKDGLRRATHHTRRAVTTTPPPMRFCRAPLWATLALVIAAGLGAFALFAHSTYRVGPATVTVSAVPGDASTTFALPPFGSLSAETHHAPLTLRVSLDEVDVDSLRAIAMKGIPSDAERNRLIGQLQGGLRGVVQRGLAAAMVAGLLVGLLLRRRPREILALALAAAVLPAALLGWAYSDFDGRAFDRPKFRGALTYAPNLIDLVQRRVANVTDLRGQVSQYAKELSVYYDKPQSFASGGSMPGTYRVLVESDIHMDPVGLQLSQSLARDFDVDFVIDAGDIDNYGTPMEAEAIKKFLDRKRRVFVPGNHESPAVVEAIRSVPQVSVLDSGTVDIDGIRILGYGDPKSHTDDWKPDDKQVADLGERYAEQLRADLAAGKPKPDIIVMHNPKMQKRFAGLAPLVVTGHTHKAVLEQRADTWWLNAGTTGGVLFSKLRPDGHIPHTAQILYYTASKPRKLMAIDQIEVYGVDRESSLKRTIIDPTLLPRSSAPAASAEGSVTPATATR